jgi:hypothetical protein
MGPQATTCAFGGKENTFRPTAAETAASSFFRPPSPALDFRRLTHRLGLFQSTSSVDHRHSCRDRAGPRCKNEMRARGRSRFHFSALAAASLLGSTLIATAHGPASGFRAGHAKSVGHHEFGRGYGKQPRVRKRIPAAALPEHSVPAAKAEPYINLYDFK